MIISLLFCAILALSTAEDELLAVSLIFRHGDRTPIVFPPNDPYKDPSLWPTTAGELTNEGKRKHYELGKWLRSRYDGFLSPIYDKNEIYVRSSDVDRCIMSVEANLASLYRPQGKDVWNEDFPWQPIPIHTLPLEIDDIAEVEKACPKILSIMKEAENLPQFKKIKKDNEELIEFLENKTGANLSTLLNIWDLYDTLHIEYTYNFTMPKWAIDSFPKLKEISKAGLELYTCNTQTIQLCVGRFYDALLTQFQNIISSDSKTQKFKVYSAHDTQVFSVLNALEVENLDIPPYAALVAYELRRSEAGYHYVQIFYKKDDVVDVIEIPKCDSKCEIGSFKEILKSVIISKEEYRKKCNA